MREGQVMKEFDNILLENNLSRNSSKNHYNLCNIAL